MKTQGSNNKFYRHQWVDVRSAAEISATLDEQGCLDGLPFMPEMLAYCGKRLRVHRRADRTCVGELGFRHMRDAVFLEEARCSGAAHDGCQRGCLMFWKEAWLKPAGALGVGARAAVITAATKSGDTYRCQSTMLVEATTGSISRWDIRPFLREIRHGEMRVFAFVALVARTVMARLGKPRVQPLRGQAGKKNRGDLHLQTGEQVQVKTAPQIAAELDDRGANCGMVFRDAMHQAIGGRYRVAFPVTRIIVEETGKMVHLKNTVALDGVTCEGPCVAHCPRKEFLYWRESWLERGSVAE
jgi:hypothetical protein